MISDIAPENEILVVSEAEAAAHVTHALAFDAVKNAFLTLADGSGTANPVVIGNGPHDGDIYAIKSGLSASRGAVGLKIGSYWPGNGAHGIPRHSATTVLLDPNTGRVNAVVSVNEVNCYRTAAADAVAASVLANPGAKRLTVFGAGHQAWYEVRALAEIFAFDRFQVVARTSRRGQEFCKRLAKALPGSDVGLVDPQVGVESADIILTVTTAREPLFEADWVNPGTHIASMGSDQQGKQELPVELFSRARLYCDLPSQSREIGEFQHLEETQDSETPTLEAIGDVLSGKAKGRQSSEEITVFDSSGIALQEIKYQAFNTL